MFTIIDFHFGGQGAMVVNRLHDSERRRGYKVMPPGSSKGAQFGAELLVHASFVANLNSPIWTNNCIQTP
jgi:hypothetical protein